MRVAASAGYRRCPWPCTTFVKRSSPMASMTADSMPYADASERSGLLDRLPRDLGPTRDCSASFAMHGVARWHLDIRSV